MKKVILSLVFVLATGVSFMNASSIAEDNNEDPNSQPMYMAMYMRYYEGCLKGC